MMSDEMIKDLKRRNVPPPGAYHPKVQDRVLLGKSDKSEKRASFMDVELNISLNSPP